jgi:serine/threonine protein phosphatase 1
MKVNQREIKVADTNTYFVVSDIHGFYSELLEGLASKGFNSNNPNHTLVVIGDIFDRGSRSMDVYNYLKGLHKDRRILIRGNHEDMFVELVKKSFPSTYDFHNKTVDTFCQLTGHDEDELLKYYYYTDEESMGKFKIMAMHQWKEISKLVSKMGIDAWIQSDEWVNYYELGDFLFTHSFIPLREGEYNPKWRSNATEDEWIRYRTGCPWRIFQQGYFKEESDKGKILVFGHWHTSEIHRVIGGNVGPDINDIFYGKGFIALDGGVQIKNNKLVHHCNVLVIKDNKVIK